MLRRARVLAKRMLARFTLVIEFCHDCGVRQPLVWRAADDLWLEVMGDPGGVVCPVCFTRRADALGISLDWRPAVGFRR